MPKIKKPITEKIKKKTVELMIASSSHGLPNIFRSKRIINKIIWLCLFIVGTLFGILTVMKTVKSYLKYEVVTKIDVITEVPTGCE